MFINSTCMLAKYFPLPVADWCVSPRRENKVVGRECTVRARSQDKRFNEVSNIIIKYHKLTRDGCFRALVVYLIIFFILSWHAKSHLLLSDNRPKYSCPCQYICEA